MLFRFIVPLYIEYNCVLLISELRPGSQDGHILLNDCDSLRVRKTKVTAEKLVRGLLTKLVHLMKGKMFNWISENIICHCYLVCDWTYCTMRCDWIECC